MCDVTTYVCGIKHVVCYTCGIEHVVCYTCGTEHVVCYTCGTEHECDAISFIYTYIHLCILYLLILSEVLAYEVRTRVAYCKWN